MNKLKVLFGSLLVLATMLFSSYALLNPLQHPVCVASLTVTPSQATQGQTVTFDASSSYCFYSDSNLRIPITNYVFHFGDGNYISSTNPVVAHVYKSIGSFSPSLTVSAQGWQAVSSSRVNVVAATAISPPFLPQSSIAGANPPFWNTPPFITSFNAYPRFGYEPLTVTFNGSAIDRDGDPLTYTLFFNWGRDNTKNVTGPIGPQVKKLGTYIYNAGMYQAKIEVSDGKNKTSRTVTIHVNTTIPSNKPPEACLTASETIGYVPLSVNFDGSCSYDPDGTIILHTWRIEKEDGTTLKEETLDGHPGVWEYTFTEKGRYFVYLKVVDDKTASDYENVTVVTDSLVISPPVLGWYRTEPASGYAPLTVTFKGSAAGIYPLTYVLYVSINDRSKYLTGVINQTDSALGTWLYITGGPFGRYYTSELVVTDPLNKSSSKQFSTFVAPAWSNPDAYGNKAPLIGFSYQPEDVLANEEIQFIDQSTDPDGNVIYWIWNFGDGTHSGDDLLSGEQNPKHVYSAAGNYTVSLKVYDNKGYSNYTTKVVEVKKEVTPPENLVPSVDFTYTPEEVFVGDTVYFNEASNDQDGEVVEWFWDFGDGSSSSESNPTHIYSTAATYTVSLTVWDNDGAENSTSKDIEVKVRPPQNRPPVAAFVSNATTGVVPFDVQFDGSYSYDFDGYVARYLWRVIEPNGNEYTNGGDGIPYYFVYSFNTSGRYRVSLTVWDNEEANATKVKDIFAYDYRLIINAFTADPSSGLEPLLVNFNVDFTGETPVAYILFYNVNDRALNSSGELTSTNASLGSYNYTAGDYIAELVLSNQYANATAIAPIHVSAIAPPAPEGGIMGGGGGGMYLTQPTPLVKTNGTTYLGFHPSLALNGTRTYMYDPATNKTTILFKLTNLANFNRTLMIRDIITKDMAASMMDVQVIPVPANLYNMDPEIGWNVTLGPQETFTAKYIFNRQIPFISFDAMPLPTITELKLVSGVPTEVPVSPTTKVTVPGGITGFVITTLSNPWVGAIILIVILVLFFAATDTGKETWGKISKKTNKFISAIAEELEEPKEYKEERAKRLRKLMKKKRR